MSIQFREPMNERSWPSVIWRARALVLLAVVCCASREKRAGSNVGREDSSSLGSTPASAPTSRAASGRGRPSSKKQLLFIGTSLTAGYGLEPDSAYPQLVQQKIDSAGLPFEVTNAGVSGETTSALASRLDWLLRGNFDVVVLESGANDGLRGIPVEGMRANLVSIISRIRGEHPNARVMLVQMEAPPNMGSQYTVAFHDAFPAAAREAGVPLLPFLLDGVAGRPALNQGDGMHPNMTGEHIVASNMWRSLEPILREVALDSATSTSTTHPLP
jgi:acyl-CoA thioesterase I